MLSIPELRKVKAEQRKLVMVTGYDYSFAKLISETDIDLVLVGDSVSMVMHGHPSTVHADIPMMELHTKAVARGTQKQLIISDMPFLSMSQGVDHALLAAGTLIRAGAHAVKVENVRGFEAAIDLMVKSGIPVMGHLGLTPQSVNVFGGMKVQAKTDEAQRILLEDARLFQSLGACALVLECVPSPIANEVTKALEIPTIGIGAGPGTDGQVLVLQDLLGFQKDFKPKFLKSYFDGATHLPAALQAYAREVREGIFPNLEQSYGVGQKKGES
jgi:3-methyl-2-oxobutanoate hydroxymethyltransferase